ncbi:hypothetical protein PybrP1_009037 [[Pythium] brassicae (nom. inval.)]|nr:hypothetical protein PybrP1_009037 [[Pythium] brassicae (nom. inval.)]
MILDDPLSALDVHVANSVFFQCVLGLVRDKTRVLVLNSHYHLLPHADRIIVLSDGKVVGDGSYDEVKSAFAYLEDQSHSKVAGGDASDSASGASQSTHDNAYLDGEETASDLLTDATYDDVRDSIVYSETPETMERLSLSRISNANSTASRRVKSAQKPEEPAKGSTMMLQEDRQTGKMGWRIYAEFFSMSGYNGVFLGVLVFAVFAIAQGALLGSDYFLTYWSNGSMSDTFGQKSLLWLYVGIVAVGALLSVFRAALFTEICIRCSQALHAYFFRLYFQTSARELKRLDGVTRSPFLNLVAETINGIESIRSFRMADAFSEFDSPANLLAKPDGIFASLMNSTKKGAGAPEEE